ncbi:MAG: hypothetical protein ACOCYZ_02650 [Halococcoides sp.]
MHRVIGIAVLAVVIGSVALVGPTAAQTDGPELRVEWDDREAGTVTVSISHVPDGLSGFELTFGTTDESTVESVEVIAPESVVTDTAALENGTYAYAKFSDGADAVTPGDENVDLVRIDLADADTDAAPPLGIATMNIQDEDGSSVDPSHDLETVETPAPTETETTASGPGFGAALALAGVVTVGVGLARRP